MNLNNYARECGVLNAEVGNIKQWVWPQKDTQTFNIIVHDWFQGIRPILQEFFPDGGRTVIQAGGNCGVYPLLYTEFFNNVYTFEPDPLSFFCLVNNCQMPGISKFNCALGEQFSTVVMDELIPENRGMNKVRNAEDSKYSIPVLPLDSFNVNNIDLIQLDLEGYEDKALLGATNTINNNRPIIIVESAANSDPAAYSIVLKILEGFNYTPHKQITRLDTVFLPAEKQP